LEKVFNILQQAGGSLIDSSPMYGYAEKVVGEITVAMPNREHFFYASKVWTTGQQEGIIQMNNSLHKMQRSFMDLMQVHNLTDWKNHLETLYAWKQEGKIRYTGITHYTDAMHDELEMVFSTQPIDFVQFNYSILSRHAEKRLLQAAADRGVATLINRPLGEGKLFQQVKGKPLPAWAADLKVTNWASFFLKYILAHPAVTCVIPATSNPLHAVQIMEAAEGPLPNDHQRKKMLAYLESV
jgi:diketogulonate reductase-like aldo/keto reductase